MTWVAKSPKPADFCGCAPCPHCFDWSSDGGLTNGMSRFTWDMLGGKTPNENETEILNSAAQSIHESNLKLDERIEQEFRERDEAKQVQMQADAFLADKRKETDRPKTKLNRRTCDDMDLSKINDPPKPDMGSLFPTAFPSFESSMLAEIMSAFGQYGPGGSGFSASGDATAASTGAAGGSSFAGNKGYVFSVVLPTVRAEDTVPVETKT